MSETDPEALSRAEKAARAKEKLKKFQKSKAGASGSSTPKPPKAGASGASTPVVEKDGAKDGPASEPSGGTSAPPTSNGSGLPDEPPKRVDTPEASAPDALDPSDASESRDSLEALVARQQQTISLLVSEKSTLSAQIAELEAEGSPELQAKLNQRDAELTSTRADLRSLEVGMKEREESSDALSKQVSELTEKLRDSERDTEVLRHFLDDTREQVAEKDQRIQQLEEQVASNVNAAELEQKLIAKSDHADSLEVEVSRQRQAEGKLRGEKESLETKLQQVQTDLGQVRRDLSEAKEQGNEKEKVLVTVRGELEALKKEKESLEAKAKEVVGLTQANEEFAKKLESATAGLSTAETERASAEKRADAAEQRKRDLQKDNQDLISRLDELQTSYVEATNGRAALEMELEKSRTELKRSQQATEADSKTLAEQDKTLQQKEASIKTLTEQLERVSRELEYAQDESKAKVTELETELKDLQQRKSDVQGEIERYKMGAEARIKEIADLKGELEGVKEELSKAASEKEEAAKAHSELSKELESLRTSTQAPSSHGAPLDREYVDSIQQQHELDLSTARTQIRTLENRVFEEESHRHELLKRVGEYQDQVRGLEESLRTERDRSKNLGDSVSPSSAANPAGTPLLLSSNHLSPTPSPSSGRSPRPSPSHRRSASHLPTLTESLEPSQRSYFPIEARASPSPRPPIPDDVPSLRQARAVPPSARHARKVSLSMLKTRMEDELGVPDLNLPSQRQDSGFITPPPLSSSRTSESPLTSTNRAPSRRIQHDPIFCSSCRGDMVVI